MGSGRFGPARARLTKTHGALAVALLVWFLVEAGAQWRSHVRLGLSIVNSLVGQGIYADDPLTGLKLLRPSAVLGGRTQTIRSNRHGLRSPDIPFDKPAGSVRIAVLGASTVMGAYTADNSGTFAAQLQDLLRQRHQALPVDVINAGVAGLTLQDQTQLFDKLVRRYEPDTVIVYPGFNDFAAYCRDSAQPGRTAPQALVDLKLPQQLMSVDLLVKNTGVLRESAPPSARQVDARRLDLSRYQRDLDRLMDSIQRSGARGVMATNARSYQRSQPLSEQQRLARTARYYNPCFDLDGLHTLYERHNALIAERAAARGFAVLRLDQQLPGGEAHFVDATHFSAAGEALVAHRLAELLDQQHLVQADSDEAL